MKPRSLGWLYAIYTEHHLRPWERPTSPEAQQAVQRFHAHLSLAAFCADREKIRGKRKE